MESHGNGDCEQISSVSASEASFVTDLDGGKVTLAFDCGNEVIETYKSLLSLVHPGINLFTKTDGAEGDYLVKEEEILQVPSLAIVFFLTEDEVGKEKFCLATDLFQTSPWNFHHSEWVPKSTTKECSINSQDYYRLGDSGPLCAVRPVPCGNHLVRMVRFVSHDSWDDNIDLYSLILGQKPEICKPDFCLYTTGTTEDYDIQFALKRVPKGITCSAVPNANVTFRITYPGHLVPLLPFVCLKNGGQWKSRDYDNNDIFLEAMCQCDARDCDKEVAGKMSQCAISDTESMLLQGTLEPVDSDSVLSDSTLNAFSDSSADGSNTSQTSIRIGKVEGKEAAEVYSEHSVPLNYQNVLYVSTNNDQNSLHSSNIDSGNFSQSSDIFMHLDSDYSVKEKLSNKNEPHLNQTVRVEDSPSVFSYEDRTNLPTVQLPIVVNSAKIKRSNCYVNERPRSNSANDVLLNGGLPKKSQTPSKKTSKRTLKVSDHRRASHERAVPKKSQSRRYISKEDFLKESPDSDYSDSRDILHTYLYSDSDSDTPKPFGWSGNYPHMPPMHDRKSDVHDQKHKKSRSRYKQLHNITDDVNYNDFPEPLHSFGAACVNAYASIEKDLEIINNALYGHSSQKKTVKIKSHKDQNAFRNESLLGFYV